MIPELRDLSYEQCLKECGLTTLVTRRLRGDQTEVFEILNGYENIDRNMFFSLKKDSRTRGHKVKLLKDQCRLDIMKYSFSQRTINEKNKLSTDCVTASSMNTFKNKVDTYFRRAGWMANLKSSRKCTITKELSKSTVKIESLLPEP